MARGKLRILQVAAGARPRSIISTCRGLLVQRSIASSSSGLYATTLPAREPASAEMTSLGLASSIRLARLTAAKPPNTTEWIAPIRAQASIANAASGIIGR